MAFQFDSFISFKLHLTRLHYSAHLRRDLRQVLSRCASDLRCPEESCAATAAAGKGEGPPPSLRSEAALMHHLAVQHDRVMAYLSTEERRRVREVFEPEALAKEVEETFSESGGEKGQVKEQQPGIEKGEEDSHSQGESLKISSTTYTCVGSCCSADDAFVSLQERPFKNLKRLTWERQQQQHQRRRRKKSED